MAVQTDIYDTKAKVYGLLPWVKDSRLFEVLFNFVDLSAIKTVIDLGCGPALCARFLESHYNHLHYLGVDSSHAMLQEVKKSFNHRTSVEWLNADFTNEHFRLGIAKSIVLLKNVLHLIPDYTRFIQSLPAHLPESKYLLVAETISPDVECLEWIQGLFWRIGRHYKENWFERATFLQSFDTTGLSLRTGQLYEQTIDVDKWLDSFGLSESQRSLVDSYIEAMPMHVHDAMQYGIKGGSRSMLRLQMLLKFELGGA